MNGKVKGQITVFLSLMFTVMVSLLLTVVEGARIKAIRFQTECVADMAMDSALAEYNRELFSQYDLLFIDTSYGNGQGNLRNTEEHIRAYMNANFRPYDDVVVLNAKDWMGLSADEVELVRAAVASDEDGACVMSQILTYMKGKVGADIVERYMAQRQGVKGQDILEYDVTGERKAIERQIDDIGLPKQQISEEEWEEVPLDNPADTVNASRGGGILSVVTKGKQLSKAAVNLNNYASRRQLNTGSGLTEAPPAGNGILENLTFGEYLFEKCSRYDAPSEKALLQYQIEYILSGKQSDIENLKSVVNKLLLLREASNVLYLFSDSAKMAQAEALALSLTAVVMLPELAEPVKYSILFAWAYAESVNDVKILLDGGRIPLIKTSGSWHTSLSGMTSYKSGLQSGEASQSGLSYEEYLRLLLMSMKQKTKMLRFLDIVEMDVRKTEGNAGFRMDCCIDDMEIRANVSSIYGYHYDITRKYGYYQ